VGPRRLGDPAIITADPSKAINTLNWQPRLGLHEMVKSSLSTKVVE
jgi:UDP-glucose 4-epimerase